MPVLKRPIDIISVDKRLYKNVCTQKVLFKIPLDKMSEDKMSVDKMSVDKMSLDKM